MLEALESDSEGILLWEGYIVGGSGTHFEPDSTNSESSSDSDSSESA